METHEPPKDGSGNVISFPGKNATIQDKPVTHGRVKAFDIENLPDAVLDVIERKPHTSSKFAKWTGSPLWIGILCIVLTGAALLEMGHVQAELLDVILDANRPAAERRAARLSNAPMLWFGAAGILSFAGAMLMVTAWTRAKHRHA